MTTEMLDSLTRRRERQLMHFANVDYVARFCDRLRRIRGQRSQTLIACMADVVQSYISRVESGSTNGMGYEALCRILEVYKEIEDAS